MPAGLLHEEKEELMSKKKQSINYLDLIPQRAETLRWHTDEATGLITLEVENTGVFNTIAQKCFINRAPHRCIWTRPAAISGR